MRDLRKNEAVLQLAEEPVCLTCDGRIGSPNPDSGERLCGLCGAPHHAAGEPGLWHVRPIATTMPQDRLTGRR